MGGLTDNERKNYENTISSELKKLYDEKVKNCSKVEELIKFLIPDNFVDKDIKKKIEDYSVLDTYYKIQIKEYEEKFKIFLIEETFKKITEKEKEIASLQKTIKQKNELEEKRETEIKNLKKDMKQVQNDLSNKEKELSELKGQPKDSEKKNQEQENKIQEIMQGKKTQEEKIKKTSEDSQTKIENEIKKIEERHKKELEDLNKKYNNKLGKSQKEEIQKKKNRIEKISNINTTFNQKVEEMKESKIKQILEQHKKDENFFCLGDILKCWEKNVSFFMNNLFKSEKIISTIIYHLKLFINEYKKKLLNIEHLNIILVGPCGVGKSTLINAILKVNAKENFGKPETKDSCYYESEEIPFLRLADSRGIEKDINFGVDQIFESIQRFIKSQIETNDPDKFIHCIWYCWTGTRLEENEMNRFKKLSETYSLETIPIIIVYTRAIDLDEVEKAKNYILNENKLNNDFIDVVSKDTNVGECIVPSRNLDILKEISIKRAKEAIKSSCYEGILNEVKKKIKETIEKLMNELKNKSNSEANKIISSMTINSKIETLHKETENIITTLFYQYFFLSTNVKINQRFNRGELGDLKYKISENSKNIIKDFSIQYFEEIMKIYQDNIDSLIKIYSKELLNEIMTFQNDFNRENDNLLEVKFTSLEIENSLQNYIYEKISKTIELTVLKNSLRFIITPLIAKFGIFFEKSYISLMESKNENEFSNYVKEITKVSFESLEKKIKEYNELNKTKNEKIEKKETTENKVETKENENLDDDLIASLVNEEENPEKEKIKDVEEAAPTKSNENSNDNKKIKIDNIQNDEEKNKNIKPKVYIDSPKVESKNEKIPSEEIKYSSKDIEEDTNIGNLKKEMNEEHIDKNEENIKNQEEKKSNNTENMNNEKRYKRRYIRKNY